MLNLRLTKRFATFALLLLGLTAGCHTPLASTSANTYETEQVERFVSSRDGFFKQVLLYIPNRIVDAFDMVNVGIGIPLSTGVDVRITKWGQLALQAGVGVGVGYDGRSKTPGWASASATAAFGPFRGSAGVGTVPSVGAWEVGVAYPGMKLGVDLAEILDFVLGFFFIDLLEDDYGWTEDA